jgi:hypothetical protein
MGFRCLLLLFFISIYGNAQFYSNGQNASSVNWRQIKTKDFQIIFPKDFNDKAQELANIISYANEQARSNLNSKPKRISIIIQNNTTVDNGFVTLAPWRSEFYSIPSQENEGVNWLKKLAIHEYRHIIQLEKFREGVGKVLYILMGEQGLGALTVLTTPLWFLEGDAVSIETRKTKLGRGGYGPFLREFKAQLIEGDSLSYEKASFGSYKDYVTDHYKLGYHLVEFVKVKFGETVWDSVLTCVAKNPFVPYPFSYHLKRITGKTTPEIYSDLYPYLRKKWTAKDFTENLLISINDENYTSYLNPVVDESGNVYCLRKSFDNVTQIVLLDSIKNRLIHIPGRIDQTSFSYGGKKLLWAEKRRDPRWQYRDFSEMIIYDLVEKKKKRIKRRTKWFGGSLNTDGSKIALVEMSKSNMASIVITDLNGSELNRLSLEEGMVYHPSWIDSSVLFVNLIKGTSYLMQWSFTNLNIDTLYKTQYPLSYPKVTEKGVVLQASINGEDEIVIIRDHKMFYCVTPEFGLQFPTPVDDYVYYADYHTDGMRIVKSSLKVNEEVINNYKQKDLPKVDTLSFDVKKYYPLLHLFNIHSWAPVSIYPDNQELKLGLSLFSQNKLSSSTLSMNYDYDWIQSGQKIKTSYELAHFYPVFFADYIKEINPTSIVLGVSSKVDEETIATGTRFSWLFDNSKYVKNVLIQGAYVNSVSKYDFDSIFDDTILKAENIQLLFYYGSSYRKAKKNIFSKWSFSFQGRYYSNLKKNQTSLMGKATATIPGFFKNNGLKLAYSDQRSNSVFVPNYISESRGYLNYLYEDAQKASVDYAFPLLYPDLKLGKLAYIQRLRMDVFYDYMRVYDGETNSELQSFGIEFNMELNPFRYSYLTQLGVEFAYTNNGSVFFSPIFRIRY